MQQVRIRKGIKLRQLGAPHQDGCNLVDEIPSVHRVALCGEDFRHLQPEFLVEPGDRVTLGQALFTDRHNPDVVFTAPSSGIVRKIDTARRRTLGILEIECQGREKEIFSLPQDLTDRSSIQTLLLKSGLWTAFRTRPFSKIPKPFSVPANIFVTAMDTEPLAADPRVVIQPDLMLFRKGLDAIAALTDGTTYVCQSPGNPMGDSTQASIKDVAFTGPHPSGLVGTHIHALSPVQRNQYAWSVNYQDVISLGELLDSGTLRSTRVIALSGTGIERPRLIRSPIGANLQELTRDECTSKRVRLVSGSTISGSEREWLGRFHCQVTAMTNPSRRKTKLSVIRNWANEHLAGNTAIIPDCWLDTVSPITDLTVPLLRALSVGDIESAEALGCLGFAAEDIAPLSHACTTGHDYVALLHRSLDLLESQYPLRGTTHNE